MKKIIAIALTLVLALGIFAACGGKGGNEVTPYEGTLTELMTKLYEAQPVEFPAMTEGMAIDLADADSVKAYLGLDSADGIAEAMFSESMMGSQAYSLVLARVSDTAKIEELKAAVMAGVNPAKWICVEASQLRAVSSGDIIMFIMLNPELGEGIADGMIEGFKANVGELSGETLAKG